MIWFELSKRDFSSICATSFQQNTLTTLPRRPRLLIRFTVALEQKYSNFRLYTNDATASISKISGPSSNVFAVIWSFVFFFLGHILKDGKNNSLGIKVA